MTSSRTRVAIALLSLPLLLVGACSSGGSASETQGSSGASSTTAGSAASSAGRPTTRPGAATSSTGASPTGSGTATNRCHTSELTGRLLTGGAGAGQRYATLTLRNSGQRTCTIHGYGGLGLVDSSGRALPTKQVRDPSPAPTTIRLAPGGTASSDLHWGAIPGPGDNQTGDCQPTPAAVHVIPPDGTDFLSVPWNLGSVCEGGTIEQRAYVG